MVCIKFGAKLSKKQIEGLVKQIKFYCCCNAIIIPFFMIKEFTQFVKDNQLFDENNKVLLAISGGIDSVAMLRCFKDAEICAFGVAHCNFALRGEDSDADEEFVKKMAKRVKAPFHSHVFDTQAFAEKEKISIQMAARQLRYAWFAQLMDDYGYDYVATAHHKNDALETVLFNLTKGTGIAGLHGIKHKFGKLVRPILFADKEMIMDFVAQKQLAWREDSSNESVKYARNLIRHEVVPVLKQVNPDLENTFQNTIERIAQVEEVYLAHVAKIEQKAVKKVNSNIFIDMEMLMLEKVNAVVLHDLIKRYGFNFIQAKDIQTKLLEGAGKIFESPTHQLNIDREALVISPKDLSSFLPVAIFRDQQEFKDGRLWLKFSDEAADGFKISANKRIAALDLDKLTFPLEIRKWQHGDFFFPLGMKKKKKLSDFMIDEKIPLNLKREVLLLTSGNAIAWVIGHRIDDRFKITNETKNVLKVQYNVPT